jgi:cytochrome d ubiquinol oxidase subunit II
MLLGIFAVAICAYLAATYLTVETEGTPLESDFRRRAMVAGVVAGLISIACLTLTPIAAPPLARALFGRGLPLLILALINGPIALVAVWLSRPQIARVAVVAQVVFVLWAWAVGQWPYLIPPDITIQGAAAPAATLTGMLVVIGVGMLFLLPSLGLLFYVFKARNPGAVKQPQ